MLALVLAAAPAAAGHTARPALAPRLPELLSRSTAVVVGAVDDVTEHDDGRLFLARVRVDTVLKGDASPGRIEVVEERRFRSAPPIPQAGTRVAVFLVRARPTTQLRRALPAGDYHRLAAARFALIDLPDAGSEQAVVTAVRDWLAVGRLEGERDAAVRRIVFSELAAQPPRLVEDGAAALPGVPRLRDTLTASEQAAITRALGRVDLPERIRLALVAAVADAGLGAVAPALRDLPGATPALLRASAAARLRLGTGPDQAELDTAFREGDAATRAAHVPALLRPEHGGVAAVAALALGDPDPEVRVVAIEALGGSGSPAALSTLARTFVDPDRRIHLESARAIHRAGGRPAAEVLADLAFTAPGDLKRRAAALLLTIGLNAEDPLIVRVRDTHPDPEVRELVTHGLRGHSH
jgi:HEAT repeat protein